MNIIKTQSYENLIKEAKKKGKKWPDFDPNPWAVCTKSVGREDKEKYERCVNDVKEKSTAKD